MPGAATRASTPLRPSPACASNFLTACISRSRPRSVTGPSVGSARVPGAVHTGKIRGGPGSERGGGGLTLT